MITSEIVKASAGSGKTYNLTERVFSLIRNRDPFIVALTFTKAATAEMQRRILDRIDGCRSPYLEKLHLIMRAGRIHFATLDSFFYLLLAAQGDFFQIADEKETELIRDAIKKAFFREIHRYGKISELIICSRILRTSLEKLTEELHENNSGRFSRNVPQGLDRLIGETARVKNEIKALLEQIQSTGGGLSGRVRTGVVDLAGVAVEDLPGRKALLQQDLSDWKWLGKSIDWAAEPYAQINRIFKQVREKLADHLIQRAVLRELTLTQMHLLYEDVAKEVKDRERKIFFKDVLEELIALDRDDPESRPALMTLLFELGLGGVQHLLIDEFQDTSSDNMALLLPLIEEVLSEVGEDGEGERSLFVVGDWKQMIYAWRGADREAVERHLSRHQGSQLKETFLPYNWRSTPLLIGFFNEIVSSIYSGDEARELQAPPPGKSYSGISEVNLVRVSLQGNRKDTIYEMVVDTLKKKKEEWNCPYSEITLLFRTNNEKEAVAQRLAEAGIGFAEVKGRQILASEEGVSVFSLLAHLFVPSESGLIKKTLELSSLGERLREIAVMKPMIIARYGSPYGLKAVSDVIEMCRGLVSDAVIETYQEEAEAFFRTGGASAEEFLSYLFKVRNRVTVPEPAHSDRVKLATIHGTKGLQFRHVFLLWLEQNRPFPFFLPEYQCHVQFNGDETAFWQGCESPLARIIVEAQAREREKIERERANILYVALTRATHTITVFVKDPGKKDDNSGKSELTGKLISAIENGRFEGDRRQEADGISWRRDYGRCSDEQSKPIRIIPKAILPGIEDAGGFPFGIDRSRLSKEVREGIERGERIHRYLARVRSPGVLPDSHDLSPSEFRAVAGFLADEKVADILFRNGTVFIEQPISNRRLYGIVDRMIIDDDRITLIDFKTGAPGDFIDSYREQALRYVQIVKTLYPDREVEAFLMLIDEDEKVLEIHYPQNEPAHG